MDVLQDVVLVSTDDMQAMYLDGELVEQAPRLSIESVLEALCIPFVSHFLSSPCNPVVRKGVFPILLNRIVVEDDSYISRMIDNGESRG